jgi:hypothetical protein
VSACLADETKPRNKGGRPKGSKNQVTITKQMIVRKALADAKKLPLQVFLDVMNGDESYTPLQLKAAELAAPYIHPRLVAMKVAPSDPAEAERRSAAELGFEGADAATAARLYAEYMNAPLTAAGAAVTIDAEAEEVE